MTSMDTDQRERFERAVDRKREQATERSHAAAPAARGAGAGEGQESQQIAHERPQGVVDPRTKNSGHGQKTADKWNQ
jgi:hypothetical protein